MSVPDSAIRYRQLGGDEVRADATLRRRLGAVYADAFGMPPYDGTPESGDAWAEDGLVRHAGYPGFSLAVAERDDELLGFAYGLLGAEDQWFTRTLRERLHAGVQAAWVGGHGELVELAVVSAARGAGIGGQLHDDALAQLWSAGVPTVLLAVHIDAAPARALYRSRGWQPLGHIGADTLLLGQLAR